MLKHNLQREHGIQSQSPACSQAGLCASLAYLTGDFSSFQSQPETSMVNFLRGWRRKVGTISLLFAILCAIAFARSSVTRDEITIGKGPGPVFIGISRTGHFSMAVMQGLPYETKAWESTTCDSPRWGCDPNDALDSGVQKTNFHIRMSSVSNGWTFVGGRFSFYRETSNAFWFVGFWLPYLAAAIPLSLISACLLLWKPKVRLDTENRQGASDA
ncbi:MAG: hypothetical protein JWP89_3985 [Schlesneria sp.]|nr:hypothetical protein [Schlesneria sp.]